MANNENKLNAFVSVINQQADARCERIKKGTDKYIEYELNRTRKTARENAKRIAKVEVAKLSEESNTDLYKARNEKIKQVTDKRNEIAQRVFCKVEKQIADFVKSKEYLSFLQKSVKDIVNTLGEETVIYIRPEDEKYATQLEKICKGVILDSTVKLGGCKGENNQTSICADDTLDERFNQAKQEFYSFALLSITGG